MPDPDFNLPSDPEKLPKLGIGIKSIIAALIKSGRSPSDIAHTAGISEESLRQFLKRSEKTKIQRTNETLKALFNYIIKHGAKFPTVARDEMNYHYTVFEAVQERLSTTRDFDSGYRSATVYAYKVLQSILRVPPLTAARTGHKIQGEYIAYRASTVRDRVIRSLVTIAQVGPAATESDGIWEFSHTQLNRYQEPRKSNGVVIPISNVLYLLGDVEEGEGLEVIALKEPDTHNFKMIKGFISSTSADRQPFVARIVLVPLREQAILEHLPVSTKHSQKDKLAFIGPRHRQELLKEEEKIVSPLIDNRINSFRALLVDEIGELQDTKSN